MTSKKAGFLQICLALGFAAAMIVAGWLLRGSEYKDTVVFLFIAVWWVPFSALLSIQQGHSVRDELSCFKRQISGLFARGK